MNGTQQYNTPWGQFNLWPQDHVCKTIIEGKFWDIHLKPIFDSLTNQSVVIDVGSNIGFLSIYLANKGCIVHSFEANEVTYDILCSNIKLNNLEHKVIPYNVVLYDEANKPMRFLREEFRDWYDVSLMEDGKPDYTSWKHVAGFALVKDESVSSNTYWTKTLDSFDLQNVSLIKIDAQGCDLRVMKGAIETISKFHPKIIFEFEKPLVKYHNETFEIDYINFINEINYELILLNNINDGFHDYLATYKG